MDIDELNLKLIDANQQLLHKEIEIENLRSCEQINKQEIKRLRKLIESQRCSHVQNDEIKKLFPMLTHNQILIMSGQRKRVNWTCEEIARGFALSFFNRRGYDYLVNKLMFPMPYTFHV